MQHHVLIMTGAGISADSGVRTFRDAGGLWEGHRPEDVATPEAWAANRALVWRFYQERRTQLGEVAPNPAHVALAEAARVMESNGVRCTLVTQNVDDLHERAGSTALHMHGEISVLRCTRCAHRVRNMTDLDPATLVPCPQCGHPALRPDVVWFGEVPLHLDEIEAAVRSATCCLSIGTSGTVWPAAGFLHAARDQGAKIWVQALEPPANRVASDRFMEGRAKDVVHRLMQEVLQAVGLNGHTDG